MSILPAYLCSFSSVTPFQRIGVEGQRPNSIDRSDQGDTPDKNKKYLAVRSGDVVSDYGDVYSPSHANRTEKSAQNQQAKDDRAEGLSSEEKLQVAKLKQRDAEVKAHEAAHMGAAGGLARGGARYEYQKGPDGKNYAIGGEVSIDSSPVRGDPNATLAKAQQIRSAALAPASPSSQDLKVAAKASQMEAESRSELAKNENERDSLGSQVESDSPVVNNKDKMLNNLTSSQYVSNTAVMKYSAQSDVSNFASQTTFRAIA